MWVLSGQEIVNLDKVEQIEAKGNTLTFTANNCIYPIEYPTAEEATGALVALLSKLEVHDLGDNSKPFDSEDSIDF